MLCPDKIRKKYPGCIINISVLSLTQNNFQNVSVKYISYACTVQTTVISQSSKIQNENKKSQFVQFGLSAVSN